MSEFLLDDSGQVVDARYRARGATTTTASRSVAAPAASFSSRKEPNPTNGNSDAAAMQHSSAVTKEITLRPRTKYEQSIMDRIPQRQKDNLMTTTSRSNAKGSSLRSKSSDGPGYIANPAQIEFLDFSVGEERRQSVVLTNVALSFNAFKVQPPPPLYRDVLEVQYTPQSQMSAGMSCTLTVIFTPKENLDLDTELTILAPTGPITIPVICRRKRVDIVVSSTRVDLGSVVVADKSTRRITIANRGALGVKMSLGGDILNVLQLKHHDSEGSEANVLHVDPELSPSRPAQINLKAASEIAITFSFTPLQLCSIDTSLYIAFDHPDVQDVVIFIKGQSIDVPVFVSQNQILDMQCCFYNVLYRDTVTIKNTLGSAVRVTPEIPACLKGMIELVPKFGFVQPLATLDFQVKFTPNEGIAGELDAAVKLMVSDQAMPIFFQLKASLTKLGLSASPQELNFGTCSVGEALQIPLLVTSNSRVPKRVAFVNVPSNITISPFSTFSITPGESLPFDVAVVPPTQGQFTQMLQLRSENDEVLHIPVTGQGKPQPVAFSSPVVKLPVCAIGQKVTAAGTTLLVNRSSTAQRFCFKSLAAGYGVAITPVNGVIEKGASVPIMVSFEATPMVVTMEPPPRAIPTTETTPRLAEGEEGAPGAAKPGGGKGASAAAASAAAAGGKKKTKAEEEQDRKEKERFEEERRLQIEKEESERAAVAAEFAKIEPWEVADEEGSGETWSRHRSLLVPCYIEGWSGKAVMLQIRCTVVQPSLIVAAVMPNAASRSTSLYTLSSTDASSSARISYGGVPADQVVKKKVVITNVSDKPVRLAVRPLDSFGPFRISCPPLPQLLPQQLCEVTVDFKPSRKAVYTQEIIIDADNGVHPIAIHAAGEGLPAALTISLDKTAATASPPPPAINAVIPVHMGYVLVNDRSEVPLYFTNHSSFPLLVTSSFLANQVSPFNSNATIPFSVTPKQVTIPANTKVEVMALFTPTVEGPYRAACEVEFGGERMKQMIQFEGYGCDRGIHVIIPPSSSSASPEARAPLPSPLPLPRGGPFALFGDITPPPGASVQHPLLLDFSYTMPSSAAAAKGPSSNSPPPASVQQFFVVNAKGSTNGEFTVEGLTDADVKNGWKVDPVKSALTSSSKIVVTVTFTPTQVLLDSLPIPKVSVVSVCQLRLITKGGQPNSDAVIHLRCKGTVKR